MFIALARLCGINKESLGSYKMTRIKKLFKKHIVFLIGVLDIIGLSIAGGVITVGGAIIAEPLNFLIAILAWYAFIYVLLPKYCDLYLYQNKS